LSSKPSFGLAARRRHRTLVAGFLAARSSLAGYEVHMWDSFVRPLIATIIYSVLGIVIFALGFLVMNRVVPFSLRKEIEEDQNTALAIVMASVIIGLAIVIAAAIHG
jgi:uncharacterized membrane protein YjfL (UPF0719 family)